MNPLSIVLLQHAPEEQAGYLEDWALSRNHRVDTRHIYRGEPIPLPNEFDLLIPLGGPMGVYESAHYTWMGPEIDLLASALTSGKKVLGICLGAQLLASALGARVYPQGFAEIGWFPVYPVPGPSSFLGGLLLAEPRVLHWHGDTFDLPSGAERLAFSRACPNQLFRFGSQALGMQFHLEFSPESLDKMTRSEELPSRSDWVQSPDVIRTLSLEGSPECRNLLFRLLDGWLGSGLVLEREPVLG